MSPGADFDAGDAVILHGLRQATHLNGCRAVVHEYQGTTSGRFTVKLDERDASQMQQMVAPMPAVLPRNMALDYAVGTKAMLRDLVRTAHLNGRVVTVAGFCRRRCRFIVEMPADQEEEEEEEEEDEQAKETKKNNTNGEEDAPNASANDHDATLSPDHKKARPNTPKPPKQQVVKPANLTHLPGCRPARVPVCEQRLVFTGSMASITKVLDHSPHRPSNGPFANIGGGGASNRYGLLSESMSGLDTMSGNASIGQVSELMTALDLWHKIKARSYASVKSSSGQASNGDGNDGGNEGYDNGIGSEDVLPPFYQKLVKVSDEHTHKICFNPICRRHILPCTQKKMKRCTNCRAVAYCGRDCASADWSYHKKMCRIIQREDARFADFVTLTSPNRKQALETQRMVRLCANRVASMEDPEGYLSQLPTPSGDSGACDALTAKLLYRIVTDAGGDVANQVLRHLENPPPAGKEATVAVGFRSLCGPVFGAGDIQKFANIYNCTVTSQVLGSNVDENIVKEPSGERVNSGAPEGVADWLNNIAGEGNWQFLGAGNGPPPNFPGMPQGGMAMQFAFPPIPVMNPGGGGGGGPPAPDGNPGGPGPFPMPMPAMFGGGPPPPAQQGADPGGADANGANGANMHNHFEIPGLPPGVEAHVHVVNAGVVHGQPPQVEGAAGGNGAPNEGAPGGNANAPNNDAAANGVGVNDNIPFVPEGLNAFLNGIMNNPGGLGGAAAAAEAAAAEAAGGAAAPDAGDDEAPQAEDEVGNNPGDEAEGVGGGEANDAGGNGANNIPLMPEGLNALLSGIMNNAGNQAGQANGGNGNASNEDDAELAAVEDDEVLDGENGGGGDEGGPNPNPNPNANPLAFLPNLLQGIQQAVAAAGAENANPAGENPDGNGADGNEGGDGNGQGMPMPFPAGGFQIPGLPGGVQAQVFAGAIPVPMGPFDGAGDAGDDEEEDDEAQEMNIED